MRTSDPIRLRRASAGQLRCLLVCALSLLAAAALAAEPPIPGHEILRLRIVNDQGGTISVSRDQGQSWSEAGHVLAFTTQVNRRGYTASKWAPAGRVAATAVNAIHICAGYNADEDRGVVFSLLPREMLTAPSTYSSFLSPDSSIYTDLPAGTSIFGGGDAPFVGSQVFVERGGQLSPVTDGYLPARADVLVIIVTLPTPYPVSAEFENHPGGAVWLRYGDGSQQLIGWVVRPVGGIGRFLGAIYTGIGRIRANHTGVLDISTSPIGELGGFQIIPFGHSLSPEMGNAWKLTQWMIIGPATNGSPLWESLTPLFYQHIRPDYRPDDLASPEWRQRLLSRFLVEVDLGGGWRPMPALRLSPDPSTPLPDSANTALSQVKHLRLLFPLEHAG